MWKVQLLKTVTFLGRYTTLIFRWAKPRPCRCPGALPRIRRILDARFLNFRYSFRACMVFFLTTAPLSASHLCPILEQYTQGPFQLVDGQVTSTHTQNVHTRRTTGQFFRRTCLYHIITLHPFLFILITGQTNWMTIALILMVCLAGYMEMKMEGVMAY